jgi:hypothetical protein
MCGAMGRHAGLVRGTGIGRNGLQDSQRESPVRYFRSVGLDSGEGARPPAGLAERAGFEPAVDLRPQLAAAYRALNIRGDG